MLINDLYTNKTPAVTEANDPNFVGFMNNTLGDRVDAKPEQPKTGHDWYDNAPTMSMDNMPSYKHAFKFGMSVLQSMDAETKQHFAEADNDELFSYLMKLARKKGFEPKYFVEEDMWEVTGLFSEIFHDPSMQEWEWADLLRSTLNNQGMTESMAGKVVFSGTGANGAKYEIIQSSPTDFMIHANGKHIDTYGSLQRAMSVLKNEVPGLQQGVAEDNDAVAAFLARGGEIQNLKPQRGPKRSGVSFASKHIGAAGGRGNTKGKVSGLGANTGKGGKPVVTAEDDENNVSPDIMNRDTLRDKIRDAGNANPNSPTTLPTQTSPTQTSTNIWQGSGDPKDFGGGVVKPLSQSGVVTKAQLDAYRRDSDNPNATLGQYMNQQKGLTARKGGANDPAVIGAKQPPVSAPKNMSGMTGYDEAGRPFNAIGSAPKNIAPAAEPKSEPKSEPKPAPAAIPAKAPAAPAYTYDPVKDLEILNKSQPHYNRRNSGMPSAPRGWKPSIAQNESISQRLTKEFDHMLEHLLSEADPRYNSHRGLDIPPLEGGGGGSGGFVSSKPSIGIPQNTGRLEIGPQVRGSVGNAMRLSGAGRLAPAPVTKSQAMATQRNVGGKEIPRFLPNNEKAMNSKVYTTPASSNPDLPTNVQIAPSMRPAPTDKNFSDFLKGQGSQTFGPAKNTINPTNKPTKVDIPDAGDFYPESKNITNRGITNTFEDDAAYDPFANDPAADAKHEADVFAKLQQQNAQGKGTKIKDMNPIDRDQYLKNTNRQWDDKTQRIVPATKPNVQEVSLGPVTHRIGLTVTDPNHPMVSKRKEPYQKSVRVTQDVPDREAAINQAIAHHRRKGYKVHDHHYLGTVDESIDIDPALAAVAKKYPSAHISKDGKVIQKPVDRPYTPPQQDAEKQQRDLTAKYPNIDDLVADAERNRDPQYDRAEGNAYYAGRDAEHNYHKLKQIQRMIRGAELDEMDFGGVSQITDSDTGDVTTNFSQGPLSVSQTKTPGGYTKQTDQQVNLGTATLGAKTVGPNIGAGQLAGTTTKTATNNITGQAKQQVKGVGFGGASGATVGKNYVGSSDDELARHAADSVTGINEEPGQVTVDVPGSSFTADKSTNTLSGTTNVHGVNMNATKDMTPGGATTFSANMNVAPNLNIAATQKSADYNKGQLAGTKSVAAKYTDTTGALGQPGQQHTATRTMGVGFGGASGANVGKNYVDQYSVNESVDRIRHLAGIKPAR